MCQYFFETVKIKRLTNKFRNFSNYIKINPELIIININTDFTRNLSLDKNLYCSKNINKTYKIYLSKKNNNC